jgi:formate dehydrogenase subunit gamma
MPPKTPPPQDRAQPDLHALPDIIAAHLPLEGALLPMLHAIQDEYGFIPAASHAPVADALNITKAELHGVISFYHDFRATPAGHHVLKLCRAEACQAMGGAQMSDAILAALGVEWHGTTPDGRITVEPVYCLGLCACAPAAMVDGRVIGAATPNAVLAEVQP